MERALLQKRENGLIFFPFDKFLIHDVIPSSTTDFASSSNFMSGFRSSLIYLEPHLKKMFSADLFYQILDFVMREKFLPKLQIIGCYSLTVIQKMSNLGVVHFHGDSLQRMPLALQAERSFLFVRDEATAAQLDEELEDDVLVLPRQLDLLELVEDELILALPLVPRHETCPQPLPMSAADAGWPAEEAEPHPFAALAALKKPPRPS